MHAKPTQDSESRHNLGLLLARWEMIKPLSLCIYLSREGPVQNYSQL